jgi:hypothetical protein
VVYEDVVLLDYAAIEDVSIPNVPGLHLLSHLHLSKTSANGWVDQEWLNEAWPDSAYYTTTIHSTIS